MVNISTLERLDCSVSPAIVGQLNARKDEFQMMPEAAAEALRMVKDPSCQIGLVARTIERDVKLAASILTVANSAIYSPGRPIAVVRDAVINVGFHQCQSLIQACCAKSLMQSVKIKPESARDTLLLHSLTTAAFASALNRRLELGFQGEEFTAGLLHDLGRLLLGALAPELFGALYEIQVLETEESLQQEQALVGADHCALGCFFAIMNRLPDPLAEAVRFHHSPELATIDPILTSLVAVADQLATYGEQVVQYDFDVTNITGWTALEANVGTAKIAQLAQSIEAVVEETATCVDSLSTPSMA